jgi:hypothetical protein
MIHGFFRLPAVIDRANDALAEAAAGLRSAFPASNRLVDSGHL